MEYARPRLTEHAQSGPGRWATFRIEIDAGENPISTQAVDELVRMVDEYKKNVRSHLVNISCKNILHSEQYYANDEAMKARRRRTATTFYNYLMKDWIGIKAKDGMAIKIIAVPSFRFAAGKRQ